MGIETIASVGAVLGTIGTIAGVVFALGKRDARLDVLEDRVKEDREKNCAQHTEFYETGRAVISISTDMKNMAEQLRDVKDDVRQILDRLPTKTS